MKKVLATLLAVLLCVCVIGGVASADGDHPDDGAYYESLEDLYKATPGYTCSSGWIWKEPWQRTKTVEDGYRKYTRKCSIVISTNEHYVWVKEAPSVHTHTLVKHEAVAATCTTGGNVEYWYCSGCQKYFSDSEGKNELKDVTIVALGHNLTHHNAVAATCTTGGNVEYWQCERDGCGKLFSDSEGKNELEKVTLDMLGHDLTHHNAVAATCTKGGNVEYWQCERDGCGKLFSDSEGKNELEKK